MTGVNAEDERFMRMALEVARNALGHTGNNPAVGTIIVRGHRVVARGWTQPPGEDHAEPHALRQPSPEEARGATLYVTLEPCCHHGRTPPCTDAILRAGILRVVVGTVDPFPLVSGRGIAQLREAGVVVDVGVLEAQCKHMNLGFLRVVAGGLPEVTLKAAISLDGRIATESGDSRWITGPEARAAAHQLRSEHDAVVVGIGTVLADDPELTVRLGSRQGNPLRVVLDSTGRSPPSAKVHGLGALVFCTVDHAHGARTRAPAGTEIVGLEPGEQGGRVSPRRVLEELARRGARRVLVEGGGKIHRAFLDADTVDTLELFTAGKVLAGGPGFVGGPGFALPSASRFALSNTRRVGADLWTTWDRA
ncbi:MAG: bifunctional diaminohydroxyphosphoribosylaminopyrimidine deaminase/5-amino-6-(5-phosphoribosylamino)uracil reductase RibD [Myxococcales bacterium]|nr:bifunctional diaminohydroxyphosphoribosylaminopyrimidine deaminase/5-amino-6-(5-phosphoribosylamino)uracil reductase RibD [Myxococcales bacterium]